MPGELSNCTAGNNSWTCPSTFCDWFLGTQIAIYSKLWKCDSDQVHSLLIEKKVSTEMNYQLKKTMWIDMCHYLAYFKSSDNAPLLTIWLPQWLTYTKVIGNKFCLDISPFSNGSSGSHIVHVWILWATKHFICELTNNSLKRSIKINECKGICENPNYM